MIGLKYFKHIYVVSGIKSVTTTTTTAIYYRYEESPLIPRLPKEDGDGLVPCATVERQEVIE
jgi:hypothetical protein